MGTGAEFAIAAMAMTAIGTGISVYGQMQQSQAAAQMAAYNQQVQQQAAAIAYNNALMQNEVQQRQNQLMQQQIRAEQVASQQNMYNQQRMTLLNMQQSDSRIMAMQNNALSTQRNAQAADNDARLVEAQARERARRQREEGEKMMAAIRSRNTRSNLTSEGTPLLIMAESAGVMELAVADSWYEAGLRAEALRQKSRIGQWQAKTQLWETRFENMDQDVMSLKYGIEAQNFALEQQVANYDLAAAQFQGSALTRQRSLAYDSYQNDLAAARVTGMQGQNQARAGMIGAAGSLFSGVGSLAGSYADYSKNVKLGYYG